ncbi:MAG TPA: flagellar motor switch protein FliN [Ignavibacteria bacterium]
MTQDEIDQFLGLAGSGGGGEEQSSDKKVEVQPAEFEEFNKTDSFSEKKEHKIDMLLDLSLPVSIELGKTSMMIKDILELERGSIIEFDKMASEPVDILINGKKMAEGEVVVIDKHFGIRITSLTEPTERLRSIRR